MDVAKVIKELYKIPNQRTEVCVEINGNIYPLNSIELREVTNCSDEVKVVLSMQGTEDF